MNVLSESHPYICRHPNFSSSTLPGMRFNHAREINMAEYYFKNHRPEDAKACLSRAEAIACGFQRVAGISIHGALA